MYPFGPVFGTLQSAENSAFFLVTVGNKKHATMSMSLNAVQQKFVAKCESKCQGGTTVARQLRKMFQQVDLDNDGLVNIREWAAVVESTNGAISSDEACALFEFWDTAGYARDPNGAVSISEAIASLMSSEVQSEAVFDDRGRGAPPPSRGGESDGTAREQQDVMGKRWTGRGGILCHVLRAPHSVRR